MNSFLKNVSLWIVLLIIAVLAYTQFSATQKSKEKLSNKDFEQALTAGQVKKLSYTMLGDNRYDFRAEFEPPYKGNTSMRFLYHEFPQEWKAMLDEKNVPYEAKLEDTLWVGLLYQVVPLLLIIGVFWFFMFRQMQDGSNKALSFGKSAVGEDEILRRVEDGLASEIRIMLDEGVVAAAEDIDLCLILGAGWPFQAGGATPYLDRVGASERAAGGKFHEPPVAGTHA